MSRTVRAEIVGVGTELLLGQIANTNARWMGERLSAIGVDVLHHQVVGDNLLRIVEALRLSSSRADVVLVTGGLGPTEDDITRDAIAELLQVPMVRHDEIERFLRDRFAGFGHGEMPGNNLRQADVPRGVRYIMPEIGSAPGLIAALSDGGRLYAMPGVPAEMVEMMERVILPELGDLVGGAIVRSRTLRCVGIGESRVAEILADLFAASANPSLAYLASDGEVKIRITAKAAAVEDAETMIAPVADVVAGRLGDAVFTRDDESLEQAVIRSLRASERTLACAESLTGGGVSARLTSVPGASSGFLGAVVVYTTEAKRALLGVTRETIDGPGVVSRECALEMARGVRDLFGADLGISLTGAAGPEPHDGAAPGTTWIGLAGVDGVTHARGYHAPGERPRVRRWAEQAALDLARRHLTGLPLPGSDRII